MLVSIPPGESTSQFWDADLERNEELKQLIQEGTLVAERVLREDPSSEEKIEEPQTDSEDLSSSGETEITTRPTRRGRTAKGG